MHDRRDIPLEKRHGHSLVLVRLIAVGKLLKSSALLIIGIYILVMIARGQNAPDTLRAFADKLHFDTDNKYIHSLLEKSLGITEKKLQVFSVGTLLYGMLYLVEGIGLFWDRGWAEWMTVITTAGFIPIEIYELTKEVTTARAVIFILNVLILIYISMRLRWRHLAKAQAHASGQPLIIPRGTLRAGIKP